MAYSPLARGGTEVEEKLGEVVDIFNDSALIFIAKSHARSVAQVILNFLWNDLGVIVIPKTEDKRRLDENIHWNDFKLSHDEINRIRKMDKCMRTVDPKQLEDWGFLDVFA